MPPNLPLPKKLCFVTIGATASFDSLISATLHPSFLRALEAANYTDLLLQHGREGGKLLKKIKDQIDINNEKRSNIRVNGFDFNKNGLVGEMRAAKGGREDGAVEGVVISHAGTLFSIYLFRI